MRIHIIDSKRLSMRAEAVLIELRPVTDTAVFPNMVLVYTAALILRLQAEVGALQLGISLFPH
jgi:hypothetical protein